MWKQAHHPHALDYCVIQKKNDNILVLTRDDNKQIFDEDNPGNTMFVKTTTQTNFVQDPERIDDLSWMQNMMASSCVL